MSRNMKQWFADLCDTKQKKALPILSFPAVSLLGIPVCDLIGSAERQAEGMRLVASRVDSAAAVSLMDLSVEAECFGADVRFSDDEVPTVTGQLIHDEAEADTLEIPKVGAARSGIYLDAIRIAAKEITDRPVLAGMIGPFSLAARLLDVSEIMVDCYDEPDMVHTVMKKTTAFLIEYAKAYRAAGADGIVMAEPVAGLLSPSLEAEFAAPYVKEIVDAVQDDTFAVVYHNCGDNTPMMIPSMLSVGAMAYHFGNAVDLRVMLEKFPADVPVMGNVDPAGILRSGTPTVVRDETLRILRDCSAYPNFIISSGCDIPPMTPWENVDAFFGAVKDYYEK